MIAKKAFSFLLLAIFLFNIVGYFVAFKIVQHQVRKEIKIAIKQGLSENELTTIVLNKSELAQLVWEKVNKEFYYKGELYDIVRVEENSNSMTYQCINDKQEKQLFEHLDEHVNTYIANTDSSKKEDSRKIHLDSIKLYLSNKLSATSSFASITTFFNTSSLLCTSNFLEVIAPPPQAV